MRRLSITYAMHFQYKHKHTGVLFEGKFKNVIVDSSEQLLHLSKYIHLNPTKMAKKVGNYPYSSLPTYLKQTEPLDWLYPKYVLKLIKNYNQFIYSPTKESDAKKIESLTLE